MARAAMLPHISTGDVITPTAPDRALLPLLLSVNLPRGFHVIQTLLYGGFNLLNSYNVVLLKTQVQAFYFRLGWAIFRKGGLSSPNSHVEIKSFFHLISEP